jgi:hypothetical protein
MNFKLNNFININSNSIIGVSDFVFLYIEQYSQIKISISIALSISIYRTGLLEIGIIEA